MRVYLEFLGCRLNEAEQASWRRQFNHFGHAVVSEPEDADVMALNTCAVTAEASKKSRRVLRMLHRRNPSAKLVATGCYATLSPEKLTDQLGVDMVIPNLEKSKMVEKIQQAWGNEMPVSAEQPDSQPSFAMSRTRAFIKVQDGCRNRCSYCIVTIARGDERSRRINEIIEEIHHLETLGYQEVVITGVHLGGYGTDIGENLRTMIEAILEKTSIPRIRIGSLEPWDFPDNFYQLWNNNRLCPHLHLPLQSGSNSVLRRMIRRCSVEEYKILVEEARQQNPHFHISSDFIIGFPGETETEFHQTIETIKDIGFGDLHLFRYSAREGTAAMRLPGHVSKEVIKQRLNSVQTIASDMKSKFQHSLLGNTDSILWERTAEPLNNDQMLWKGYTRNYLRVHTVTDRKISLFNQITTGTLSAMEGESILVRNLKSESIN
jgi:threonylcarbamoyladenosine tRNA methylthiotransferase MtaB